MDRTNFVRRLMTDPVLFVDCVLGLKPFPYQSDFLRDPSDRIIICSGRQIGKSFMASARAIWYAMSHPGTNTLIVSATLRQSMLMFDKITSLILGSPVAKKCLTYQSRTRLEFSNGSWIIALPCGRDGQTLRGHTAHQIIIDEAAFVPNDVISNVALPMLSTTNGKAILLSTPNKKDHIFYKAYTSPSWSKYHFPTSMNPLVKPEFIEEQRELCGEELFRREFLGEFVDDQDAYFPMTLLDSCVHRCPNPTKCEFCLVYSGLAPSQELLFGGYDPGGKSDPAAFIEVELGKSASKEGRPKLRCVKLLSYLKKSSESDDNLYSNFTVRLSDLHHTENWKMQKMLVDTQGIGSPIIEHCKSLKLPADGMPMTMKNKEIIFSHLRLMMEQKQIELPHDLNLLTNLNCIQAERTRSGGYTFSHLSGTHDDFAYALGLAVYAATGKPVPTIIISKS